jgi:protein-S-isoprenylcysteine O-methyltransferase Ste14
MGRATARVTLKAMMGLAELVVVIGLVLFIPAGTVRFLEGWIFLTVFSGASLAITLYLMKNDPALLERRTQAGPLAEKERSQKIIQALAGLAFLATLVVPALDRRFRWFHGARVPLPVAVAGEVLVVLGFFVIFLVFRANTYTSSVIEVAAEQRVIETGPYAVVRHPMYSGALVMFVGVPLALGSFVGLVTFVPIAAVIVWRLLEEERFLSTRLAGYQAYCEKTRYRLVPRVW